jgi:hypothetical protein
LSDATLPELRAASVWAEGTPALLPITDLTDLLDWYTINLCQKKIVDPRGQRVTFLDTDFIHLIKLVDGYEKRA